MDRNNRKQRVGVVVSRSGENTVTVMTEKRFQHPLYKKTIKQRKKYLVDDANQTCELGNEVRIVECRPISKRKTWRVAEVVKK